MTWRIARLNVDAVLASDSDAAFDAISCDPPATGESFLSTIKQTFRSDEELAQQLRGGDADALAVLFRRHSPLLFQIARRILRNDTEAEDAVQQIFFDVFRSIRQFDQQKGSFKTWLLMFAYHRSFNSRRSQIANRFFDTEPLEEQISGSRSLQDQRSTPETAILVEQVLRSLQPRQRRTIELIYYEGLTAEEVSTRTGESVRVIRHNLYRGLHKLRQALNARTQTLPRKGDEHAL
jgi:RNA polymerase sigma-70 factor (ECF subfamily)